MHQFRPRITLGLAAACVVIVGGGSVALLGLAALSNTTPLLAKPATDSVASTSATQGAARVSAAAAEGASRAPGPTKAVKRGFLMGFTSWPYAATIEAVQGTYAFIGANADLITEHLDDGVPWAEALRDAPFPKALQEKFAGRRKNRPPGAKLLLSLTPLNMGRNGLAPCAGEGQRPALPAELAGQPFNQPKLVRAYANYCRRMVEFFHPDFLLTGIESNELLNNKPEQWDAYRELSREVRRELRERFPDLPLAESVTLHKLLDRQNRGLAEYRAKIKAFVETHDFFGVSFYPFFLGLHQEQQFAEALDFLPTFTRKPIGIAETGHPAEPIKIAAWKLDFPADAQEQAAYVQALLSRAHSHHYLFVTYWAARDFDELWKTFPAAVKDLGALWRDTGLIDERGQPRPAFEKWKTWFARPRE